ncbi:RNA polymerase sigma factor (sigma-70 family) [Streptomyces sp. CG 926]|uniref:sigma-70 family RNA polymerase sigma factor n=1 Tax=Streptomyces sp. CG 926 TaxID=1882405 RepID=UPI000D7AD1B7|nr:sigma-70 family RNA polymerase sigma factor [Streptomyces sp. CG 926]PWK65173.1 RNA polymerase sigma factor (sigma-70 family) [Streptomyces sp. CG 926]
MGEVFARHHSAVLAYARTCCRDLSTAHDLAAEAFARTYRAVAWGTGPEYAWRPYLLTCVRRVAADWMRRGARTQLSDDFEQWAADLADGQNVEEAVLSAEEGSLVLRAYQSLPERWQAVLWHAVVEHEPAAETARRLGISAGGVGSLAARAREGLREAYLRAHLDQAVGEECRYYGGLLAASLRRPGKRVTQDLRRHVRACADCTRAEHDLRNVNRCLGVMLAAGVLLWSPASILSSFGGQGALAAGHLGGVKLAAAQFGAVKWSLTAAVVAGATMTAFAFLPADSRPEQAIPAPAAASPGPSPAAEPGSGPPASPTPSESATPEVSTPATAAPTAIVLASAPAPAPSRIGTKGLPLVNTASGLCVGLAGSGSDGPLQLQQCTGSPSQGWQPLPAGKDIYQLRHTGTDTCLDGTTAGATYVAVTLRTCQAGADRDAQLWRFEPDAQPGAFRIWFVPQVPNSDYAAHLLGPDDWSKPGPPRQGLRMVHLPNYYGSANFLFTLG